MRTGWRDFYFRIDLRSLGLFRILLGTVLVSDWFVRWPNLLAFYTADGFLPGDVLLVGAGGDFRFNFLAGVTSLGAVRLVFLTGLVCYGLFLVGWRTRLFHAASLVFYASVLQRNDLISHGGDDVLLVFLLWSLFLPLGSRFSVDAANRALRQAGVALEELRAALAARPLRSPPSLAALVIVLQIGLIYLTTAVVKSGATWHDGTAVYYALHLDQFATPLGAWLRDRPLWLLRFLTWSTICLEYAALPLLLLPWGRPWVRRGTILGLACMHAGFSLTLTIGTFSASMLASFALLLSTRDWAVIERWCLRASRPLRAYYDDACGICRRCVRWLVLADAAGNIRFVGSSDRTSHEDEIPPSELDTSLVAVDVASGVRSRRAGAVAAVFRALPLPFHLFRLLALPGLSALTNAVYDRVARNRGRLSQWCGEPVCGVPGSGDSVVGGTVMTAPAARLGRRVRGRVADVVILLIFSASLCDAWNLSLARRFGWQQIPQPAWMASVVEALKLPRGWYMFAPEPLKYDGWWVLDGETHRGAHVDPLTDAPPVWSKPVRAEQRYDVFWRMYLTMLCFPETSQYRPWFGWYLTRKNLREKPAAEQLRSFDFWYVREVTQPPGRPEPFPAERVLLWRYDCVRGRVLPVGE